MPVDRPQLLPDLPEEVEPLEQVQQRRGAAWLPEPFQLPKNAQPEAPPLLQLFQLAHVHHLHLLHQHVEDAKLLLERLGRTDQPVALELA